MITYETAFASANRRLSIALTIGIYSISYYTVYSNYLTPGICSAFYFNDFNDYSGFEIVFIIYNGISHSVFVTLLFCLPIFILYIYV